MTIGAGIGARIHGRYQRTLSRAFFKQPVAMRNAAPVISFTFDDFPRSALHTGGAIKCTHANTGVIGQCGQARDRARIPRFGESILDKGEMRFVDFGDAQIGLRHDVQP